MSEWTNLMREMQGIGFRGTSLYSKLNVQDHSYLFNLEGTKE